MGSFVLLAGGASRRMGSDKARLVVGGRPLLSRLLDVGRSSCLETLLVVDRPGRYEDLLESAGGGASVRTVVDRRPGRGPLAGLEAGLGEASRRACFVASCDLVHLEAPLVRYLLAELGPVDVGTTPPRAVVPEHEGREQPLCAAYERGAGALAAACLDEGRTSVGALLERLRVRKLDVAGLQALLGGSGPGAWTLDLDTPGDLAAAKRRLGDVDARREAPTAGPSDDTSRMKDA